MLTPALLTLLASLALAARQTFVIAMDGTDVGFAELTIERPTSASRDYRYAWHAELAVSGDPCLRSIEASSGRAAPGDRVLPEELFVALAPQIGPQCRKVRGSRHGPGAGAQLGTGCWSEASPERAVGRLLGEPIEVSFAADLMPVAVHYRALGLSYRAVVAVPEGLSRCVRTVADDGVVAPGTADVSARRLTAATYEIGQGRLEVRAPVLVPMPAAVHAAVREVRDRGLESCQTVAEALGLALRKRVSAVRTRAGLLLDEGRWYPHAWTEIRLSAQGEWLPIDATTGDGWADAGRLPVGLLGDFQTGLALLARLHAPPRLVSHE